MNPHVREAEGIHQQGLTGREHSQCDDSASDREGRQARGNRGQALGSGLRTPRAGAQTRDHGRADPGNQIVLDASFPSKDAARHEVPAERLVT